MPPVPDRATIEATYAGQAPALERLRFAVRTLPGVLSAFSEAQSQST